MVAHQVLEPLRSLKEIYYNENNIIVRRTSSLDLKELAHGMSKGNVEELWASHHYTPSEAVELAFKNSVIALTVESNGRPCGIFGIIATQLLNDRAEIYFLVTEDFSNIGIVFLRNSRKFVDMFLAFYPYLENHVYAKNIRSMMWMKYIGAKIGEAKPYGIEGELFHHFYFKRT